MKQTFRAEAGDSQHTGSDHCEDHRVVNEIHQHLRQKGYCGGSENETDGYSDGLHHTYKHKHSSTDIRMFQI